MANVDKIFRQSKEEVIDPPGHQHQGALNSSDA